MAHFDERKFLFNVRIKKDQKKTSGCFKTNNALLILLQKKLLGLKNFEESINCKTERSERRRTFIRESWLTFFKWDIHSLPLLIFYKFLLRLRKSLKNSKR